MGAVDIGEANAAWVAVVVVLLTSLTGAVVLAEWPIWGVHPEDPSEPHLVQPVGDGTHLWPYTASDRDYSTRTLGINVVFFGNQSEIHTALTDRTAIEWEDEQLHEGDADAETISLDQLEVDLEADDPLDVISWGTAEGSVRYTFVNGTDGGTWMDESYQLHAGTYLGHRLHIRGYEDPQGEWTAVQIHDEHWDWFRLRHTVTGISDSQRELEREFMGEPFVDEVIRMPFENETADSDGWVTGITIAATGPPLVIGLVAGGRTMWRRTVAGLRTHRRALGLGLTLFLLYTGVRWAGIAGELLLPGVSPKVIAAPLYALLALGTPIAAYRLGQGSNASWAFTAAVLGLGGALVVDFVAMQVAVLPIRVVLHRTAVLLAIGLIAFGAAWGHTIDRRSPVIVGVAGWLLGLGLPLLGFV